MRADTLDDVPAVANQLAQALYAKERQESELQVRARQGRRERALFRFNEYIVGLKSPLTVSLPGSQELATTTGLMFDLRCEADHYFIELGAGFLTSVPTDTDRVRYVGFALEAAVNYLLPGMDVAPLCCTDAPDAPTERRMSAGMLPSLGGLMPRMENRDDRTPWPE